VPDHNPGLQGAWFALNRGWSIDPQQKLGEEIASRLVPGEICLRPFFGGVSMMRKMLCAVVLCGLTVTFAMGQNADQKDNAGQKGDDKNVLRGKITKVDGNKIMFQAYNAETKKLGEARELQTSDTAKFFEMKGKQRQAVSGGLKGDAFKNLGESGHWATIRMDGEQAGEIQLMDRLEGVDSKDGGAKDNNPKDSGK